MKNTEAMAMDPGSYRPAAVGRLGVLYSVSGMDRYLAVIRMKNGKESETWTNSMELGLDLINGKGEQAGEQVMKQTAEVWEQGSLF